MSKNGLTFVTYSIFLSSELQIQTFLIINENLQAVLYLIIHITLLLKWEIINLDHSYYCSFWLETVIHTCS